MVPLGVMPSSARAPELENAGVDSCALVFRRSVVAHRQSMWSGRAPKASAQALPSFLSFAFLFFAGAERELNAQHDVVSIIQARESCIGQRDDGAKRRRPQFCARLFPAWQSRLVSAQTNDARTAGTGAFRILPLRVKKRLGALSELFEPIGAVTAWLSELRYLRSASSSSSALRHREAAEARQNAMHDNGAPYARREAGGWLRP